MDVCLALEERRAVKYFNPEHRLADSEVEEMLSKALLCPSAFNLQHCRLVWVKDTATRQNLREIAWNQDQVTSASALFVLCADTKAWEKYPDRVWQGAPQAVVDFILPGIHDYYAGKPQVERDECMRSMGILAMSLMLVAKDKGLDSCPMDGFDFKAAAEIIKLPRDHVIGLMLAIGQKTKDAWPRIGKLALSEVVMTNSFA